MTHFAWRANAMIPDAIGVENEVPCKPSLVHPEEVVVEVYKKIKISLNTL